MPSYPEQVPSSPSESDQLPMPSDSEPDTSPINMIKIHSLLNPLSGKRNVDAQPSTNPSPTPTLTIDNSSVVSTPQPEQHSAPSQQRRKKLGKYNAVFILGTTIGPVAYPPYEVKDYQLSLTAQEKRELLEQHARFLVYPSTNGNDGSIADYPRHVPYSSKKKNFQQDTGRDAFHGKSSIPTVLGGTNIDLGYAVFQYIFHIPWDSDKQEYVVMWDYQVGLVRITSFFKACKYAKVSPSKSNESIFGTTTDVTLRTTPAKAIAVNPGLERLSHSITGGAIAAQGYWMPYSCARAVCLTFCYHIRWALTPIFGPSFVEECIQPESPDFGKFKIDPEIVRRAAVEADSWRLSSSPSRTATPLSQDQSREVPRIVPRDNIIAGKQLRPRLQNPTFRLDSPFKSESEEEEYVDDDDDDDDDDGDNGYTYKTPRLTSPQLSPKSKYHSPSGVTAWTSINKYSPYHSSKTPKSGASVNRLDNPFLTQPYRSPATSWRAADPRNGVADISSGVHNPKLTQPTICSEVFQGAEQAGRKTLPSTSMSSHICNDNNNEYNVSEPQTTLQTLKRKCSLLSSNTTPFPSSSGWAHTDVAGNETKKRQKHYTDEDFEAARWLLNLCKHPKEHDNKEKKDRN